MSPEKPLSMRGAAVIQFLSKYATIVVQLVITAILSRLISPEAFGQIAIVSVFTAFFALFADMGLGTAVVQFQDLTDEDLEKLFTFSLLLAAGLSLVFALLAWPLSLFYSQPALVPLFLWSTPALAFNTLNMVPNGYLLREKRFRSIGVRLLVTTVASGIIAALAALGGFGAYALILQSALSALFVLVWNLAQCPVRRLRIHFMRPLKEVFGFSSYQFGFNFINYFARNLDNLTVGWVFGDSALGYYSKAYTLTTYPLGAFCNVITSVIQPFMATHQDERDVVWSYWTAVNKFISLIGVFITVCMVTCAPQIILIMFGEQWEPSVPLFSTLSVSLYAQMLESTTPSFYTSLARTDLLFRYGSINAAVTIALLIIGLCSGSLEGVAIAIALAFTLKTFITYYGLVTKGFGRSYSEIRMFLPEIVLGLLTFLIVNSLPVDNWDVLASLFTKAGVAFLVLLVGYCVTGQIRYIRRVLHR